MRKKIKGAGNFKHVNEKVELDPSLLHHEHWKEYAEQQAAFLVERLINLAERGHDIRRAELTLFAVVESAPVESQLVAEVV